MVENWIILGFLGWIALMGFRFFTERGFFAPNGEKVPFVGYVNGFFFSLVLGPICFLFLTYLMATFLIRRKHG